jgi:zinc and cadmium transporter
MSPLSWILLATALGGVLSVLFAALFAYAARPAWVPRLVSFAVGTLLGAVFLEILPHALARGPAEGVSMTVLAGVLMFFVLEKLVLWRHCHHDSCEVHGESRGATGAHDHDHAHGHALQPPSSPSGRTGLMILVGDTFHNFVDGILIAGAFLADTQLGIITALAIIAHELPQEVGDFLVLLHSGYSRLRALWYNLLTSFAMLLGGLLGYVALQDMSGLIPYLLALAAASMLYIAVADLIPGLHRRPALSATLEQVLLILAGVGVIAFFGQLTH